MNWGIAKKNFSRQGLRASLNVLVTALSIIALIFMLSLLNGFQAQATKNVMNTTLAADIIVLQGSIFFHQQNGRTTQ